MIYVDALISCIRTERWRSDVSCHLMCEPGQLDELHAFADRIGLKRSWFQNKKGSTPHYDLNAFKRSKAVEAGAVEIDRHKTVAIIRAWREHRQPNAVQTTLL